MLQFIRSELTRFGNDQRGSIAIIFAFCLIMLLLICGLALDFARAVHAKSRIMASLDAAALSAAKGLRLQNLTDAQTITLAKKYFNENYNASGAKTKGTHAQINNVQVDIDRSKFEVKISVDAEVKNFFGPLAGVDKFDVPTTGAAIFEQQDIEVAVQLDVTGSMGGQKIADLKTATKTLVDTLIPDSPGTQKVRIGYAPFAAGVNAGTYASNVVFGSSAPDNCVYERLGPQHQDSDIAPNGQASLKTKDDLPSAMNCPSAQILPLTDNKTLLKNTVDSYNAGGCTAGHLGTAWSWYLLSPNWASIWPTASKPEAYNNTGVKKVAILMTDGEYNTVSGTGCNSSTAVTSGNFATDTCAAMKAKGIIVYTVGFELTATSAIDVMNSCATDSGKAYLAENGAQLQAAFKDIADSINRLRLTS